MAKHVVVIGAGVYGAAVTAELARRGAQVTVVDSGAPAGGTSGATFSWTNSCGKQPREYHDLSVASMQAHRKLAGEVPGSDWYHESGNLEWGGDDRARETLRAKVAQLLDDDYDVRWLNRAETLRLEPDMNPDELPDDEIAYYPREGWVEPTRMIGYLLSRAGAECIWNDGVVAFEVNDDHVGSVRLASGRVVTADAFVNCAGPRAGDISELAGLHLPMINSRGVLVYTAPVAVSVSRVIHAPRVHLRPDGAGRLLLHTHDIDAAARLTETGEIEVDPAAVSKVVEAGSALYPAVRGATVESVRVGERPIPGDALPVLGGDTGVDNFFFAVSHSGATLSLHAGALVAAEVLGDDPSTELAAFRFDRFAELAVR